MNRPGPVGFTLVLAFGLVAAIEFRTLLSMVGLDVTSTVYYPAAALALALVLGALYLLPEGDSPGGGDSSEGGDSPGGNEGQPPERNLAEA